MADERVVLTQSQRIDRGGARQHLAGGSTYLLDEDLAERLIKAQVAYPAGEPPECDICGAPFEGPGAYRSLEDHRSTHEDVVLEWRNDDEGDPPPLDDAHPEVQRYREMNTDRIREELHGSYGIGTDEVVATGSSGRIKDDWIRTLLQARDLRGYFAEPDDGGS